MLKSLDIFRLNLAIWIRKFIMDQNIYFHLNLDWKLYETKFLFVSFVDLSPNSAFVGGIFVEFLFDESGIGGKVYRSERLAVAWSWGGLHPCRNKTTYIARGNSGIIESFRGVWFKALVLKDLKLRLGFIDLLKILTALRLVEDFNVFK